MFAVCGKAALLLNIPLYKIPEAFSHDQVSEESRSCVMNIFGKKLAAELAEHLVHRAARFTSRAAASKTTRKYVFSAAPLRVTRHVTLFRFINAHSLGSIVYSIKAISFSNGCNLSSIFPTRFFQFLRASVLPRILD